MFEKAVGIGNFPTNDLGEIARVYSDEPSLFYCYTSFESADLRDQDLRGFDLTGVDFSNAAYNEQTLIDEPFFEKLRLQGDFTTSIEAKLQLKFLRVICGTEGPQSAEMTLDVNGEEYQVTTQGDGPVDAAFNAVRQVFPHQAQIQLYQVHAVTYGTDAQATVSVRLEDNGHIYDGQGADTDTVVASVKAYLMALNRLVAQGDESNKTT